MTKIKISLHPLLPSKIMSPYQYQLDKGVNIFSLQSNFLRPSIYDLETDENDPSFLSVAQKITHHQTYRWIVKSLFSSVLC